MLQILYDLKQVYDVLQLEMQIWTYGPPMNCIFMNFTLQ